jgi:hypothetical protein
MYARIARFEGGTAEAIDIEAAAAKDDLDSYRKTGESRMVPAELARLTTRVTMLADRDAGTSALVLLFDSAEDARAADAIMQGMSPQSSDMGRRVSADVYEVLVDEALR